MDASPSLHNYCALHQWCWPSSDSEFYSMSSPEAVSPDCPLELRFTRCGGDAAQPAQSLQGTAPGTAASCKQDAPARARLGRAQSRNPSKQRQSASEKEKLRMRGLTKALHHLRSYLPPSVAPAGQTLTKIETLRLTIRYIAHLSAQLGHTEEALSQPKEQPALRCQAMPDVLGLSHSSLMMSGWKQEQQQHTGMYHRPDMACPGRSIDVGQNHTSKTQEAAVQEDFFNSSLDSVTGSPLYTETAPDYQIYNREFICQAIPQEFWI